MRQSMTMPARPRGARNLAGQRFGRLVALVPTGDHAADGCYGWLCRCSCGRLTAVSSDKLLRGRTVSCGCHKPERWRAGVTKS